ncbi:MAG TPA: hypothetical protein VN688_00160, partial [Gemmataceae bacterium]|nr:hypothetical protein [Gemmataceae bacterium]
MDQGETIRASEDNEVVRIRLASPDTIRAWSSGEVDNPRLLEINSERPAKGGLFCEEVFGPEMDWHCVCGNRRGKDQQNQTCEACGAPVTYGRMRRRRMGHIELAVPVVHIWFFKAQPSRLGTLLGMSGPRLERVIYFNEYVVLDPRGTPFRRQQVLSAEELGKACVQYKDDLCEVGQGAEAIEMLLTSLDLTALAEELRSAPARVPGLRENRERRKAERDDRDREARKTRDELVRDLRKKRDEEIVAERDQLSKRMEESRTRWAETIEAEWERLTPTLRTIRVEELREARENPKYARNREELEEIKRERARLAGEAQKERRRQIDDLRREQAQRIEKEREHLAEEMERQREHLMENAQQETRRQIAALRERLNREFSENSKRQETEVDTLREQLASKIEAERARLVREAVRERKQQIKTLREQHTNQIAALRRRLAEKVREKQQHLLHEARNTWEQMSWRIKELRKRLTHEARRERDQETRQEWRQQVKARQDRVRELRRKRDQEIKTERDRRDERVKELRARCVEEIKKQRDRLVLEAREQRESLTREIEDIREKLEQWTPERLSRRLALVEALRHSGNRPEWMVLKSIPVISPDLRPLLPMERAPRKNEDEGHAPMARFAVQDFNELYRNVLEANNELKARMGPGKPDLSSGAK